MLRKPFGNLKLNNDKKIDLFSDYIDPKDHKEFLEAKEKKEIYDPEKPESSVYFESYKKNIKSLKKKLKN